MINDHFQLKINEHFQLNLVCLQFQIIDIFTPEQPMSKIDHFSAVSSLITFISSLMIKRYLNST